MTSGDLDADLAFAHDLADLADAITLPAFRTRVEVETKGDGTPVSEIDRAVEARLGQAIGARHPEHAVLGEEHGHRGGDGPTWVLDPIDGTRSFLTGNAAFATLIALVDDDGERVAVVSAPALGRRWDARRGGPARVNDRTITVSSVERLEDAQVSFGDLVSFHEIGDPDLVDRLTLATLRQRGYGDFLGFCHVAEGTMDVAVEAIASRWDYAAPKLLVEAAGGRFTTFDGSASADGPSGVATNGHLHDAVLALCRG